MLLNPRGTDKAFVQKVLDGDQASCREFVAIYTDQVLFKVRELVRCNYSARNCALNTGGWWRSFSSKPSCDECMDDYIWLMEYLKGKLKSYKGVDNCSLKTYLFSVVNSSWTKADWLRWKKGRNRLPSAIQELDQSHKDVYNYLWEGKEEEQIANLCGITSDEVRSRINRVKEELIKAGQLDLVESPQVISMHSDDPETPELQLHSNELSADSKFIIKELKMIMKEVAGELPEYQLQLLRLRYMHDMTVKEILGFLKKMDIDMIPGKEVPELGEQEVFYAVNMALKAVLNRLRERYGNESFLCPDNLKYLLEEAEI